MTRADEYSVLACPNLNGDYISDACAAQVGGLGIAPGANVSPEYAIFEATHGTAPKYADKDVINPGSVMLSGVMMLDHMGWQEAARLIEDSMERTICQKKVTYDFARLMPGATKVKTSEFATYMIENMAALRFLGRQVTQDRTRTGGEWGLRRNPIDASFPGIPLCFRRAVV